MPDYENHVTTDLAKFGFREWEIAHRTIEAMLKHGLPADFFTDAVVLAFNTYSGYVFLTNSEWDVAMLTDEGNLESYYSCPICGHEGFKSDMLHGETDEDCQEYLRELGVVTASPA